MVPEKSEAAKVPPRPLPNENPTGAIDPPMMVLFVGSKISVSSKDKLLSSIELSVLLSKVSNVPNPDVETSAEMWLPNILKLPWKLPGMSKLPVTESKASYVPDTSNEPLLKAKAKAD